MGYLKSSIAGKIRRIETFMTPGKTGGKEIEINLSPEGACPEGLRGRN